MKDAFSTLKELQKGVVMDELAVAIHEAVSAVQHHGRAADVILTIRIKPLASKGIEGAPLAFTGEVRSKLPQAEAEATVFFVDEDGNPTRNQTRQQEMPFRDARERTAQ